MKQLTGHFDLTFHGQRCSCPLVGVRDSDGNVEVAISTPFGLRRVHAKLGPDLRLLTAHTFAFDYETGEVTRFEVDIQGGPAADAARCFRGTIAGPGLTGTWDVTDLGTSGDDSEEADHAFNVAASTRRKG